MLKVKLPCEFKPTAACILSNFMLQKYVEKHNMYVHIQYTFHTITSFNSNIVAEVCCMYILFCAESGIHCFF